MLLSILAGCAGTTDTANTETATLTETETATVDTTVSADPNTELDVWVVNTSENDSGDVVAFSLRICADTRLPDADGEGDPGEPTLTVRVNDMPVARSENVSRTASYTTTVHLDTTTLSQFESGQLNLRVELVDLDIVFHDEIASWNGTVENFSSPAAGTVTPASTTPPPQDPTLTPVATNTPTPTPERSPTPTPTPEPAPTLDREERTEFRVTVVEIVDGDTIDVRYGNGDKERVRLLGVDTPEVHTSTDPDEWEGIPNTDRGSEHLRDWGHKASEFARTELERGEEIRIVVDEEADRRGSYGRLLVYVYDDGTLFNHELIDRGYARLYDTAFSKRAQFASTESNAQAGEIGVWNYESRTPEPTPEPTSTPEQTGDGLIVAKIHEDASGNDHENENDEYVVFENTGETTLDLSGWTVEDEAEHTYRFPAGFELDPGSKVTLYTGSGADTDSELYWGSDAAIWNNNGDTVYVLDEDGETVVEKSY
ncbi:lamin tail domain-containing protein [Haloarcula salina]|uniref:lamin tail domain-containing protein n=1 Tax=Haloarcula salina TaxID=1429914 RepID=UPI003C6F17DA